jgi:bacillithiol biosynthesis cysteine-adding enzyme BshC
MKANYLDYGETNSFSSAIIRYLENDPDLEPFCSFAADPEGFRQLIAGKKNTCDRQILHAVLREQYGRLKAEAHPAVLENISLLLQDSTYTVTTGHQLNLFTGPLYFIFKIVSTIRLARDLKASFPDKNFVPVYWMASEDHDFAEINHTYISGKKIIWDTAVSGATGRIATSSIAQPVREYTSTLGISAHAEELSQLITEAYLGNSNLADASRTLVNSLFEAYGLVILDADDARLKQQFAPVITEDIIHQHSYKNISEASRRLEELGLTVQVNPREINFFYLTEGLRERIVFENERYQVLNTEMSFSAEELRAEIQSHPERFSPNVVMRPLYQEIILPNLAYIGGGAEIVYWLQLKQNFDFYGIDFPILLLRNSAMITSNNLGAKLARLDLGLTDIFKDSGELRKQWVIDHSAHTLHFQEELQELNSVFEKIRLRTDKIDPTLGPSSKAIQARLQHAMQNLERKLIKAEKRNFADALSQIDSIKDKLFPGGGLQERKENFGPFYVRYGPEFISSLLENFRPLDRKFTILED